MRLLLALPTAEWIWLRRSSTVKSGALRTFSAMATMTLSNIVSARSMMSM
jgi:hypothetical protein